MLNNKLHREEEKRKTPYVLKHALKVYMRFQTQVEYFTILETCIQCIALCLSFLWPYIET